MSTDYTPDPADVELVNVAWKNATCHHFRDAVCVSCGSVAILRALAGRWAPLAEVEELATELAEERTLHQQTIAERDEARAEVARLRDELAWVGDVAEVMTGAVKRRTEERARIVAYLREHVGDMSARDIERGDHLKEKA